MIDRRGERRRPPRDARSASGLVVDWNTFSRWFWVHGAPLDKHLVYTLAALLIVALGARGVTATLMTLAFLLMAATDDGPLMGAEWHCPCWGRCC